MHGYVEGQTHHAEALGIVDKAPHHTRILAFGFDFERELDRHEPEAAVRTAFNMSQSFDIDRRDFHAGCVRYSDKRDRET